MSFVGSLTSNLYTTWLSTLSIAAMMWGIERLFPKAAVSTGSQLRALKFWLVAGVGTATAITIYGSLGEWLNPRPLLIIPLNSWFRSPAIHWSMYIVAPLLGMIVYDFFGYWLHRAQHRWFWRLHAVHHSIEELSGINSYFHWSEQFFRIAFISLPAAYLVGIDGLESVVDQLGVFDSRPLREQSRFLADAVDDVPKMHDDLQRLIDAWRAGDLRALEREFRKERAQAPKLYDDLLGARNRKWLPQIEALLREDRNYLVVVGTLHFVGRDGLLELLKRAGHTPVALPAAAPATAH